MGKGKKVKVTMRSIAIRYNFILRRNRFWCYFSHDKRVCVDDGEKSWVEERLQLPRRSPRWNLLVDRSLESRPSLWDTQPFLSKACRCLAVARVAESHVRIY